MIYLSGFLVLVGLMAAIPYAIRFVKASRAPAPAPDAVFIAHWVEVWTNRLQFMPWRHLHKDPHDTRMTMFEWVVFGFYSLCRLVSPMPYEVVDTFTINGATSQIWLVNFNIWHFIVPGAVRYIRWKMLRTVQAAERLGIKFVGLGALMKDRGLTHDGQYFADMLGEDRPRLAHGDTLTAETVLRQALALAERTETKSIFLTGATSKIGRAIAIPLARMGFTVYMLSEGEDRVAAIQAEAGKTGGNLVFVRDTARVADCKLVVTGKRTGGRELLHNATPGTTFLNFSVPDPLKPEMLEGKPFYHYDGGLLNYEQIPNTLAFAMRLVAGQITYACHAWQLVCAMKGWTSEDELGPVDIEQMPKFWQAAEECGFTLPEWTSFQHPKDLPKPGGDPVKYNTPPPQSRRRLKLVA